MNTQQTLKVTPGTYIHWWYNTGSGIRPLDGEECYDFAERITELAWKEAMSAKNNQQTQTMNTISDNEYYHVRYYMAYAEMFGPWKIQTGQEIQVHGSNVRTQIVGPIERPGA